MDAAFCHAVPCGAEPCARAPRDAGWAVGTRAPPQPANAHVTDGRRSPPASSVSRHGVRLYFPQPAARAVAPTAHAAPLSPAQEGRVQTSSDPPRGRCQRAPRALQVSHSLPGGFYPLRFTAAPYAGSPAAVAFCTEKRGSAPTRRRRPPELCTATAPFSSDR